MKERMKGCQCDGQGCGVMFLPDQFAVDEASFWQAGMRRVSARMCYLFPRLPGEGCLILSKFFSWTARSSPPHQQARGRSGHYRTSTACARSQWALPDLNRMCQIAVGTTRPQLQVPDRSGHYRTSTHNTQPHNITTNTQYTTTTTTSTHTTHNHNTQPQTPKPQARPQTRNHNTQSQHTAQPVYETTQVSSRKSRCLPPALVSPSRKA